MNVLRFKISLWDFNGDTSCLIAAHLDYQEHFKPCQSHRVGIWHSYELVCMLYTCTSSPVLCSFASATKWAVEKCRVENGERWRGDQLHASSINVPETEESEEVSTSHLHTSTALHLRRGPLSFTTWCTEDFLATQLRHVPKRPWPGNPDCPGHEEVI